MKPILLLLIAISGLGPPRILAAQHPMLVRTFNPPPGAGGYFGGGMAALGGDRVLIGAPNGGVSHLFRTDGTLLATFTNPVPSGTAFGSAIAALGNDRVLIGSLYGGSVVCSSSSRFKSGTGDVTRNCLP